ncbi:unnamed protein product, partial [Ostreobium quekettii]
NLDSYLENLKERASQRLGEFRYERKLMSQKRSNIVAELQEEVERLTLENRVIRHQHDCHGVGTECNLSATGAQKFLESLARLEAEKRRLVEQVHQRDVIIGDLEHEVVEARQQAASASNTALLLDAKDQQVQQLQDSLLAEKLAAAALEQEKAHAEQQVVAMQQHVQRQKGCEVDKRRGLENAKVLEQLKGRPDGQPASPEPEGDAQGSGREGEAGPGPGLGMMAELADLRRQLQIKDQQLKEALLVKHKLEESYRRVAGDNAASCIEAYRSPVMQANVAMKEEVELLKERIAALAARKLLSGKHPRGQPGRGPAAFEELNVAYEEIACLYDIRDEIMSELNALREEVFSQQSMRGMVKLVRDGELASWQQVT